MKYGCCCGFLRSRRKMDKTVGGIHQSKQSAWNWVYGLATQHRDDRVYKYNNLWLQFSMNTGLIKRSELTQEKDSKAYFRAAGCVLIGLVLLHRTRVVVLLDTWITTRSFYIVVILLLFVFTFKVRSDASVVAGRAAHQLVQEVRRRGGSGGPCGELHLFTQP